MVKSAGAVSAGALKLVNGGKRRGRQPSCRRRALTRGRPRKPGLRCRANFNAEHAGTVWRSAWIRTSRTWRPPIPRRFSDAVGRTPGTTAFSFQWPNKRGRPSAATGGRFATDHGLPVRGGLGARACPVPYPGRRPHRSFLFRGPNGGRRQLSCGCLEGTGATGPQYVRLPRARIVSLFISRQATGHLQIQHAPFYDYANRKFSFDDDFLLPAKLPPGRRCFRDVNQRSPSDKLLPGQINRGPRRTLVIGESGYRVIDCRIGARPNPTNRLPDYLPDYPITRSKRAPGDGRRAWV